MGYGDELVASGFARGFAARGRRAAFGDGRRIIWHNYAHEVHLGNPNVAPPGSEDDSDLTWFANYPGRRPYNLQHPDHQRWIWRSGKIEAPGQLFLTQRERDSVRSIERGFVLIEPNTPAFKTVSVNKQWDFGRWQQVANHYRRRGMRVVQLRYHPPHGPGRPLDNVELLGTATFRQAAAIVERAALVACHEGGMHHLAAAMGTPAAVIFGGFVSPDVTGYPFQSNLYRGGEACGTFGQECSHCRSALRAITVEQVISACEDQLQRGRTTHGQDVEASVS